MTHLATTCQLMLKTILWVVKKILYQACLQCNQGEIKVINQFLYYKKVAIVKVSEDFRSQTMSMLTNEVTNKDHSKSRHKKMLTIFNRLNTKALKTLSNRIGCSSVNKHLTKCKNKGICNQYQCRAPQSQKNIYHCQQASRQSSQTHLFF